MKVVGSALLFIALTGIGMYASMELERRIRQLRELKKGIICLYREIDYQLAPISEAMKNSAYRVEFPWKIFFQKAGEVDFKRDDWIPQIESEIRKIKKSHPWKKDILLLEAFIKNLGYLDKEMQLNYLNMATDEIDELIIEALDELKKKGQLYKSLGICMGILSVIIIL